MEIHCSVCSGKSAKLGTSLDSLVNRAVLRLAAIARAEGEEDVASPRRVSPTVLLVSGLGAILRSAKLEAASLVPELRAKAESVCFMQTEEVRLRESSG